MKTDEKEMQNVVLEKVDLEDVELMEETVTPSFGIYCPRSEEHTSELQSRE